MVFFYIHLLFILIIYAKFIFKMQSTQKRYRIFETFCVRNPLLPFDFIQNITKTPDISYTVLYQSWQNPIIKEAVFLASPVLFFELDAYFQSECKPEDQHNSKLHLAFLKYLSRMATRATPFGLFAGCNTGSFDTTSEVILQNPENFKRLTRFDMHFLVALSQFFAQDPQLIPLLRYFPNSSLYKIADHWRYVEYTYQHSKRMHSVEGIKHSEYLEIVLKAAQHGKKVDELAHILVREDISEEDALAYIHTLITHQILVSEWEPILTGTDFLEHLLRSLKRIQPEYFGIKLLENQKNKLLQLDQRMGNPVEHYLQIADELKTLPIPFDLKYLFQTDVYTTYSACKLDREWIKTFKKGLILLNKLSPVSKDTALETFKKSFLQRYEGREVPLTLALDVEMGLRYASPNQALDDNPILEDLVLDAAPATTTSYSISNVEELLHQKLLQTLHEQSYTLHLTDADFAHLEENWQDLPHTLSALTEVVSIQNNTYIYMNSVGGSSAANLLGRFSQGHENILRFTNDIIEKEHTAQPDVLHAEIVHLPQDRTGNILRRPQLRPYEIPYLAQSELAYENQIHLNDLYVSVQNNRFFLRSAQHNREVIPHLTNAHNYSQQALPIYHFLCDLQTQQQRKALYFSFGPSTATYPFLPRVVYDQLLLHKATWYFQAEDCRALQLLASQPQKLQAQVNVWRHQHQLPSLVQWVEHDHTLLVNLENVTHVQMLLDAVKSKSAFRLEEFFEPGDNPIFHAQAGGYLNQVVMAWHKTP